MSGGGRLRGGNLELAPVRGFAPVEPQIVSTFTFADEVAAVGRQVEEGWIALYSVGGLPKANGYTDLAASADQVITCMSESPNFYRNFTERKDLERESIQVDGHDAYSVTTELRIDDPDVQVEGDVAKVIVVDTGDDDSFGLYISVVPIGDQRLIDQQDAASATAPRWTTDRGSAPRARRRLGTGQHALPCSAVSPERRGSRAIFPVGDSSTWHTSW